MSTRSNIKQTVSITQPPGGTIGDEWFNPSNNALYKLLAVNGTSVTWKEIPTLTNSQLTSSNITANNVSVTGTISVNGSTLVDSNGNIKFDNVKTPTSQDRGLFWTAYDKEAAGDYSDTAYIKHTINTGGFSGSVLEISSQNDTVDGIAFTTNASSQLRHNGYQIWDSGNVGNDPITYTESLRANQNINGGGTISVDASGYVLWSARFIVIANGNGTNFSTSGYFDIACPTAGTITGVGGAANVTATAAGIPLGQWQALYYILPIGSAATTVAANFRVAAYTGALDVPHTWVLICVYNGDDGKFYFNNGVTLRLATSSVNTYLGVLNSASTLTTVGTANLTINTNSGTNSGNILINQGANGNIDITPNGSGSVRINASSTGAPTYTGTLRIGGYAAQSLNSNGGIEFLAATGGAGYGWRMGGIDLGAGVVPFVIERRMASATWTEAFKIDASGNAIFAGNITVNGTTTTVNSTTVTVDDPIITLGGDTAPASDDNKDRGVEFRWHNGTAAKVGFFGFDDSTGKFTFIPDATNTSEVFSGTPGTITANDLQIKDYPVNASMWSRSFALMGA